MKRVYLILFLTALLLAVACSSAQPEATPVPAVTDAPTAAAAVEVQDDTVIVKPTEVPSPTDTPIPAPTPSPTPTPSPSPVPTETPAPTPKGLLGGKYPVFSEPGEPIVRTEAEYKSDKLSITLTKHTDNPYSKDMLVYYVADIYMQDLSSFRTEAAYGFPSRDHLMMNKVASRVNAIIAINGDYYAGDTSNKTLIVRNGITYRKSMVRGWRETCILYRDGHMEVFRASELDLDKLNFDEIWQAWQFGPYLINPDGTPRTEYDNKRNNRVNPRTVLGYYEPGHYCFVVVEGRSKESEGLIFPDLAQLMIDLGCTQAFNFDGGDTSVLYWNDRVWSNNSGNRSQVDILYLVEPVGDAAPAEP